MPGCKRVIYALTGLQELVKLRAHMARTHDDHGTLTDMLEMRARWENMVARDDGVAGVDDARAVPKQGGNP